MTRYVERDGQGRITGAFANRQPGRAEEALADDDVELAAFEAPPAVRLDPVDALLAADPAMAGLVRALAKRLGVPPATLIDEIKAETR